MWIDCPKRYLSISAVTLVSRLFADYNGHVHAHEHVVCAI